MARPVCPGVITTDPLSGAVLCVDELDAPLAWEAVPDFSIEDIDQSEAAGFFAVGFIIIGSCWAIGKGAGLLLSVVRR